MLWPLNEVGRKTLGLKPGQLYLSRPLAFDVNQAVCSPDGKTIFLAARSGEIRTWSLDPLEERTKPRGHTAAVTCLAFSPDCRMLVSGSDDETVCLWQLTDPARAPAVLGKYRYGARQVAFAPQGQYLAFLAMDSETPEDTIRLWDVAGTPKEVGISKTHMRVAGDLAFSPNGKVVVATGYYRNPSPRTRAEAMDVPLGSLWNVKAGVLVEGGQFRPVDRQPEEEGWTRDLQLGAFTPDGRQLLVQMRTSWRLWDLQGEKPHEVSRIENAGAVVRMPLAFSPNGKLMASAEDPRLPDRRMTPFPSIRLYDVAGGKFSERSPIGMVDTVQPDDLTFSLDGLLLFSIVPHGNKPHHLVVWDVATGEKVKDVALPGWVRRVALAPDGRHLATANGNGTVYVFRLSLL
jgi:WD40 repeat protein